MDLEADMMPQKKRERLVDGMLWMKESLSAKPPEAALDPWLPRIACKPAIEHMTASAGVNGLGLREPHRPNGT